MRIIGYSRVSMEEQAAHGVSLSVQASRIRLYCELHGHELLEIVEDPGVSGKSLDRPGIKRVFEILNKGQADGVVIAKLDRLSRSLSDWQMMIERWFGERSGSQLMSVSDSIDTTSASGRLVLNMLMAVAQWEREMIVERVREALTHKKMRGERTGQVPYGKSLAADGVQLLDDAGELRVLDTILSLRHGGQSLRSIAAYLTSFGVPTKTGRPSWSASSIQSILKRQDHGANGTADSPDQRPAPQDDPGPG